MSAPGGSGRAAPKEEVRVWTRGGHRTNRCLRWLRSTSYWPFVCKVLGLVLADAFSSEAQCDAEISSASCGRGGNWPLAARAQQAARVPTDWLSRGVQHAPTSSGLFAFSEAFRQLGWIEGKNVVLVYRDGGRIVWTGYLN